MWMFGSHSHTYTFNSDGRNLKNPTETQADTGSTCTETPPTQSPEFTIKPGTLDLGDVNAICCVYPCL